MLTTRTQAHFSFILMTLRMFCMMNIYKYTDMYIYIYIMHPSIMTKKSKGREGGLAFTGSKVVLQKKETCGRMEVGVSS